jgi:hypothetical protein
VLLAAGASVNIRNSDSETPLVLALELMQRDGSNMAEDEDGQQTEGEEDGGEDGDTEEAKEHKRVVKVRARVRGCVRT